MDTMDTNTNQVDDTNQPPKPATSRKIRSLLAVLVVLIAAVVIAGMLLLNRQDQSSMPEAEQVAPIETTPDRAGEKIHRGDSSVIDIPVDNE